MNNHHRLSLTLAVTAISVMFTATAMAAGISKDEYKMNKESIASDYKIAKTRCDSLTGNPKDICTAKAKRHESVSLAELEARYKPTEENRYKSRVARAKADHEVAEEKCEEMTGNTKDVCKKEAKAAETAAIADAKTQHKTTKATATAKEESAEARAKANKKVSAAKKDASEDKRDAEYAVAKEKCDAFTAAAKDRCLTEAKAQYGKH